MSSATYKTKAKLLEIAERVLVQRSQEAVAAVDRLAAQLAVVKKLRGEQGKKVKP